jgi:Ca2+-binding EF-hand superfamily protein
MLGIRLGSSELERIMLGVGQRLDHHPTELFITFENYYYHAVHYLLKLPPNYQIQDTFRMLDVNGRGGITAMDLLRAVRELGISMDEEEAHRMIQEFDGDQDGQGKLSIIKY